MRYNRFENKEVVNMKVIRFFEGFLIGGVIGALVAVIMAPVSGEEVRGQIWAQVDRVRSEVEKAVGDRRSELEQQLNDLRSPQR